MASSVHAENLPQHFNHIAGQRNQPLIQPQLFQLVQEIFLPVQHLTGHGLLRSREQKVFGNRQGRVVAFLVQEMHMHVQPGIHDRLAHDRTQIDQLLRQIRMRGASKY